MPVVRSYFLLDFCLDFYRLCKQCQVNGGFRDSDFQEVMEIFLMTSFTQPKSLEVFSGNKARRPYQTLSISNNKHVANIDMNDGWNSWNLVWDEETGYLATRIFSKKVCFVSKMRKNTVPDTALFPQLIKERKVRPRGEVGMRLRRLLVKNDDLASFGQSIQAQCKGVPTYIAHHVQGPNFSHEQCFRLNLGFIHINFCTYINK
uniref:Gastrokine 1 n=1 Tax=Crocodylus porosus TaxID=8502 RepID=A0A7M4FDG8_CROPO